MSKLIGKRKQAYLAHVIGQEPAIDAAAAAALAERLNGAIRSLRVTKADLVRIKQGAQPPPPAKPAVPAQKPPSGPFDPYAFNAILTFKRGGRDALMAKLAAIKDIGQLRQLAEAQLIGLDQRYRTRAVDVDDLRAAVVKGVERLVADRRAAAS